MKNEDAAPTPPPAGPTFDATALKPEIRTALAVLGFTTPTPVQQACLAAGLERDLVAQAKTGSGKTLAFGIPILETIDPQNRLPQALVLAPTRELALQIAKALAPIAKALDARCIALTGGADLGPQLKALASPRGAQIAIGTPGRVLDHLNRGSLSTQAIRFVVLDEGDHILDIGFKDELDEILKKMPAERRTLIFSATIPPELTTLIDKHVKNAKKLVIDAAKSAHADIDHVAYVVPEGLKAEALANLLLHEQSDRMIVFCATRLGARELSERLPLLGIPAALISGELEQQARNRALQAFRDGRCHVLVATDVAARGLDVPAVSHVVHFQLADSHETYVHRSGRTGRAGRKGTAISLVSARERVPFSHVVRRANVKVNWKDLPTPDQIRSKRIARLVDRLAAEEVIEHGQETLEHARRLVEAIADRDPITVVARLLDAAVELEGEPGFELEQAIRAEATRVLPRKRGRDDRKPPRQERWARRDGGPRREGGGGGPRKWEDRGGPRKWEERRGPRGAPPARPSPASGGGRAQDAPPKRPSGRRPRAE